MELDWLKIVYSRHKTWVGIVTRFGYCPSPEDVVQDMYEELTKEIPVRSVNDGRTNPLYSGFSSEDRAIQPNGDTNATYIWIMLRRCHAKSVKEHRRTKIVDTEDNFTFVAEESNTANEEAFSRYNDKLQAEINSWHFYDTLMFNLYMDDNISLRSLAESTGISLSSVVNTLNNCKKRLIENVKDEYLDYCNGDYELIK